MQPPRKRESGEQVFCANPACGRRWLRYAWQSQIDKCPECRSVELAKILKPQPEVPQGGIGRVR